MDAATGLKICQDALGVSDGARDPSEKGLDVYFPTHWDKRRRWVRLRVSAQHQREGFQADGFTCEKLGGLPVSFRLNESDAKYMDVTLGEGCHMSGSNVTASSRYSHCPRELDAKFFRRHGQDRLAADDERLCRHSIQRSPIWHFRQMEPSSAATAARLR